MKYLQNLNYRINNLVHRQNKSAYRPSIVDEANSLYVTLQKDTNWLRQTVP